MISKLALAALSLSLSVFASSAAQASTIGFQCITNTSAVNCTTGENQLSMTVTAGSKANEAVFTFFNTGNKASAITDLYWESGSLLKAMLNASSTYTGEVSFSQSTKKHPTLPGGNLVDFQATSGLSADANNPSPKYGINPGESLGVLFSLQEGKNVNDVKTALDNGGMRVGVHIQAFSGTTSASESFVNVQAVPVPTAALLLGSGLLGLVGVARRQF